MAIDPSISLRVQGIEAPNPLTAYGQVAQIQNAQNQNALAQYQLGAAKRTDEQQNVLNELTAQNYDPNTGQINMRGLTSGLAARGHGSLIPAQLAKEQEMQTKAATLQKTQADIVAAQKKHLDSVAINLSFNPSNENIIAHNQDIQKGNFAPEVKSWAAKQEQILLGMKPDQRKAYLEKSGATAGDFVSAANNAATVAEQARGHDMADARAKAAHDLAVLNSTKPVWNEAAQGWVAPPTKNAPTGTFTPVPAAQMAKDQTAAIKALASAGYNPITGEDTISKLIPKSTSGGAEASVAAAKAFFGKTTEGRKAIASLEGTANQIATDLAGGKLGAGISNTDRDFIVAALGDVANSMKPAEERLAGWTAAKDRMLRVGLIPPPTKPAATPDGVDTNNPLLSGKP